MPGDHWQKRANLRAFLAYMWAHPGKQLLFMGSEFGQESEWSEGRSLDWWLLDQPDHAALSRLVRDLNAEYRANPALVEPGRRTARASNGSTPTTPAGNTFSWLRRGQDGGELLACVVNFSAVPHFDYRVGLPQRRALARGAQHRRPRVRRQRRGQLRRGRRRAMRMARPARSAPDCRCRRWARSG